MEEAWRRACCTCSPTLAWMKVDSINPVRSSLPILLYFILFLCIALYYVLFCFILVLLYFTFFYCVFHFILFYCLSFMQRNLQQLSTKKISC